MLGILLGVPDVSPAEKASFGFSVTPKHMQAWADELKGIPDSISQAGAVKSFGDIPLIVLSRGLDQDSDWQAGQAAAASIVNQQPTVVCREEWSQY